MIGSRVLLALAALPLLASARPTLRTDLPSGIARPSALAGLYRARAPEFDASLRLSPDGSCSYGIMLSDGGEPLEDLRNAGRWGLNDEGHFTCANDPGPARLELAAPATRDPRVALEIDVRTPDGTPARGLGLVTQSQVLMIAGDGRVIIRTEEEMPDSREVTLIRDGDDQTLWTARVPPGAPNSFVFTYHPSAEEPESLRFEPVKGRRDAIAVEVGQAGFEFVRVRE